MNRRGFVVALVFCSAFVASSLLTSTQRSIVQNARWVRVRMDDQQATLLAESAARLPPKTLLAVQAARLEGATWSVAVERLPDGELRITARSGERGTRISRVKPPGPGIR